MTSNDNTAGCCSKTSYDNTAYEFKVEQIVSAYHEMLAGKAMVVKPTNGHGGKARNSSRQDPEYKMKTTRRRLDGQQGVIICGGRDDKSTSV